MRVLITGGTGLIGRALTDALVAKNYEVVVLSRSPARVSGLPAGARAEKWDGKTSAGWGPLADGAAAIVNLAGARIFGMPWTKKRKQTILNSRTDAGQAVVAAIREAAVKPAVLIQSSAVGYYGESGDRPVTESSPAGSDFLAEVCIAWEAAAAPAAEMTRVAVIRPGLVLSTEGGSLPPLLLPFKLFVGGPLGSGRQWYPLIHMEDQVRAILWLIENEGASGPYNLAMPEILTNKELARLIGRILKRPSFFPVPAFMLRLVLGEMASLLLNTQRAVPQALLDGGFTFNYRDPESALVDLTRRGQ